MKSSVKRLGIFCFHDCDGIVDEYNLVLLNDLKKNLETLLVICCGTLTPASKARFAAVADEVLVCTGLDQRLRGYRSGIEHVGWERLERYDEVVLLDDSHFGPLVPFQTMFDAMLRRDVDFWGLAMRYGFLQEGPESDRYRFIPDHIPVSFMVIRQTLLRTGVFQQYWQSISKIASEAIAYHEGMFTGEFAAKGFQYVAYANTEDLAEYCDAPLLSYPLAMVNDKLCPVFSREIFSSSGEDVLAASCGETALNFYEYLRENTAYDINLIWDNLLRTANLADIKDKLQLNYILPQNGAEAVANVNCRVALFLHIYHEDRIEWCFHYAARMPRNADIFISTDSESKKQLIQAKFLQLPCATLRVILVENRGRYVSSLLVGGKELLRQYDYVCVAYDRKSPQSPPLSLGESCAYKYFENVLASEEYVHNILQTFAKNPRLGLLAPPPPQHSAFLSFASDAWAQNYPATKKLAKMLNLRVRIEAEKLPVTLPGAMFWFRPCAMKKLFDHPWSFDDFSVEPVSDMSGTVMQAVECIYSFVAQSAGFYSGWVLSDQFARLELTQLNHLVRANWRELDRKDGHAKVLQQAVGEKTAHVEALHQMVCERDGQIAGLQQAVGEKTAHVEALHQMVCEKTAHVEALHQMVCERDGQIAKLQTELAVILNSTSWRMTKPLREIGDALQRFQGGKR